MKRAFIMTLGAALLPVAGFAQTSAPTLTSASISGPTHFDVAQPPATVALTIAATGGFSGLSSVGFEFRSPSGHQFISGSDRFPTSVARFSGTLQSRFEGGGLGPHGLNLYSEPGTWTLDQINLCDAFRTCTTVSGAALGGVVARRTITVANNGMPVTALPSITSASILTPNLAVASPFPNTYELPAFQVSVTATDAAPGIVAVEAAFLPPQTAGSCISQAYPVLRAKPPQFGVPQTALSTTLSTQSYACATETGLTGSYPLIRLRIADEAGNVLTIADPKQLAALFGGPPTVTVTQ